MQTVYSNIRNILTINSKQCLKYTETTSNFDDNENTINRLLFILIVFTETKLQIKHLPLITERLDIKVSVIDCWQIHVIDYRTVWIKWKGCYKRKLHLYLKVLQLVSLIYETMPSLWSTSLENTPSTRSSYVPGWLALRAEQRCPLTDFIKQQAQSVVIYSKNVISYNRVVIFLYSLITTTHRDRKLSQ